tara:strand:- start:161 stop:1774 length:1614 start_codon:yes stop_codon:yes gene_type:complete
MQSTPNETANTTPIDNASYLSPEQKQLATDTFQTQVQPLREGFEDRVTTGLESLARRGIAMGDLGSSSLADIYKEQTKAEAQLASQIGTGIGAKSLDQAFQSAEAAKQREFLKSERLGGESFRTLEREGAEDFQTSEAALDRAARIKELDISQEDKKELINLNSDLEQEMLDLKNSFTTSEREAIQEYESAFRDQNFANQFDLIKYQDQQRRFDLADERLLQAIQSGQAYNLEGLEGQELIDATNARNDAVSRLLSSGTEPVLEDGEIVYEDVLDAGGNPVFKDVLDENGNPVLDEDTGEPKREKVTQPKMQNINIGIQFTPLEDVQLQRMASSAGLSVEEYKNVRNALGSAQSDLILETEPVLDEDGNPVLDDEGKPVTQFKNLKEFIRNPAAEREFQKELAKLSAPKHTENKFTVLCTELYRQGKLSRKIFVADCRHAKKLNPFVHKGYTYMAQPFVKLMQKSPLFTDLAKPIITAWAYHMAFKENVVKKDNFAGKCIYYTGVPICYFVGKFLLNNKSVLLEKQKHNNILCMLWR